MSNPPPMHFTHTLRAGAGAALLVLAAGCSNSADWFEPEWQRIIARANEQSPPIRDVPAPAPEAGSELAAADLPDLSGEGPLALSVEQAVVLALRNNADLAVGQLSPVISGAFEEVERGFYDPEVFADAEFRREEIVETARATGEQFSVRGDDAAIGAGVRQALPSGTDVEIGVTQERSISNRAPEQQSARVGLTVTQALLRGAEPAVNLATIRQAQLDTLASLHELRGLTETVIAETEIAYWRLVLAQREIQIFEQSLEIARRQLDQVNQRIDVGVLAPTERAAIESELALREQALIDARSQLALRRLELLRLTNPGGRAAPALRTREVVTTTEPASPAPPIEDEAARVELAQRSRADLREARVRLQQDRLEIIVTRNGLLPRLDLFLALGKSGYAQEFPESFRDLDGPSYDLTAGISFSQQIGNRTARGLHRAAIASRQQGALAVANLAQLIELDVLLAVTEAERARQQIAASAATRVLQERTAQAEADRFGVGASTSLQVAQAQRDLLQAQIAEVEALINYRIALVELYRAEGSLLERRGVAIAD